MKTYNDNNAYRASEECGTIMNNIINDCYDASRNELADRMRWVLTEFIQVSTAMYGEED